MFIYNTPELAETIKTYSCVSPPLKDFLVSHNFIPIYRYIHNISKKNVWIFVMCDELSVLLTEWSNNRPRKVVTDE